MRLLPFLADLWVVVRAARPGDGRALEHDVRELLVRRAVRSDHVPGGYTMLGVGSASGLCHQVDLEAQLDDAVVIGELKAYRGPLPKNDLLSFAAATDDLFLGATRRAGRMPILRAIAGTFTSSEAERRYAAMHGILLIEPRLLPPPLLADRNLRIRSGLVPIPDCERAALASLVRPMQALRAEASRSCTRGWELSPHRLGTSSQVAWSERILSATPAAARDIQAPVA